jgi:hypothetical protein
VAAAAKPLWASEVVTYLECSLFEGEDPELVPPECQDILAKEAEGASDPRLGTETAKTAAELYRELFREADPMREALQQAWDDYRPTAPADDLSGAGFRRFVEQQSTYLDALGYLTRLNALFRTVDQMGGGASGELDEWRDVLLDDVAPVGMSPEELKDAIGAGEGEIQASGGNLFASDHLPLDLRDDGAPRVGFRAMLR